MSELAHTMQLVVVVLLVAVAALVVWRRLRAMARGEAQCGKCPGCGSTERRCDGVDAGSGTAALPPALTRRGARRAER
jgi:hypothetical protein